jgi:hypothetical protein
LSHKVSRDRGNRWEGCVILPQLSARHKVHCARREYLSHLQNFVLCTQLVLPVCEPGQQERCEYNTKRNTQYPCGVQWVDAAHHPEGDGRRRSLHPGEMTCVSRRLFAGSRIRLPPDLKYVGTPIPTAMHLHCQAARAGDTRAALNVNIRWHYAKLSIDQLSIDIA